MEFSLPHLTSGIVFTVGLAVDLIFVCISFLTAASLLVFVFLSILYFLCGILYF